MGEEYEDSSRNYVPGTSYDNAGSKGLYRFDISMMVIEVIDLAGELYRCIRFHGITKPTNDVYEEFIASFLKLFYRSALLTKNPGLLAHIEEAFQRPDISLTLQGPNGEPVNANLFLNLFEEYLKQLHDDKIYDPTISRYYSSPYNAWEGSL